MEKVTPTARRERPFPNPVDVNAGCRPEDEQRQNEKEALQSFVLKSRRSVVSIVAAVSDLDPGEL